MMRNMFMTCNIICVVSFASMGGIPEKEICSAAFQSLFHSVPKYSGSKIIKNLTGKTATAHTFISKKNNSSTIFRIHGNRIHWASVGGRWRDDPRDERVIYKIENNKIYITIIYDDSRETKEYLLKPTNS